MWQRTTATTRVSTGRFRRDLGRPGALDLHVPKVRKYAELTLQDGSRLGGYVFIEATARVQDMLNADAAFFPLVDERGDVVLVNKSAIAHVRPHDR